MLTNYFTLWCQNVKVKHANTSTSCPLHRHDFSVKIWQPYNLVSNMKTIHNQTLIVYFMSVTSTWLCCQMWKSSTLTLYNSHQLHRHHFGFKIWKPLHQHYLYHISDIDMTFMWNVEAAHTNTDHLLHISVIDMTLVWNVETILTKHDRCETWKPSTLNMTLVWNVETIPTKHDFGVKHGNHPH